MPRCWLRSVLCVRERVVVAVPTAARDAVERLERGGRSSRGSQHSRAVFRGRLLVLRIPAARRNQEVVEDELAAAAERHAATAGQRGRGRRQADGMKLFGLSQTRAFAERLAGHLDTVVGERTKSGISRTASSSSGPLESVRGEHVFVCQSLAGDSRGRSANDKLMRLLVFCGALKISLRRSVTAIVPYLAYWRKDRRTQPRDPITTSYVARLMEAVGIDGVMTLDAHDTGTFDNAFRCQKENLEGAGAFAEHFAPLAAAATRVVVLSPDAARREPAPVRSATCSPAARNAASSWRSWRSGAAAEPSRASCLPATCEKRWSSFTTT